MNLKHLFLAMSLFTSQIASAVDAKNMNISGLFEYTLDTLEECIEYCIDGVSLYAIPTPWGFKYYWTLNVSHNSPDYLIMAYPDINESPLVEFDSYFGKSYAEFTGKILKSLSDNEYEVGGGRERHDAWGHHQSVAFKSSAALGHPAAFVLSMFGQGSMNNNGSASNVTLQSGNSSNNVNATDWLQNFYDGDTTMSTTPDMIDAFGGNADNVNATQNNESLGNFMSELSDKLKQNSKGTKNGQRLFCPSNVTAFMPYYLSGLDAAQWRGGYPITDFKYSSIILNPMSGDVVGTSVGDNRGNGIHYSDPFFNDTLEKTGEVWGNIYPREGTLNQPWDSKLATVIAARTADIMVEAESDRIRYKPSRSNNGFGGWGKIFPIIGETTLGQTEAACHKNVANTGIQINGYGKYAWNFWQRYNCDLRTTGIYITTVKFPNPICLTPEVPQ